jgi:WD40 repeat protein
VLSGALSPDGLRFVTAFSDGTAHVWDTATTKEIAILRSGDDSKVTSAAFSPDGSRIVTTSENGTARVWDIRVSVMTPERLLKEVCQSRLRGVSKMTRYEMRLAGYPDSEPLIDVCAGVAEAGQ